MFRPTLQGRILLSFIAVLVLGLVLDHLYARAEITRHLVAYLQAQGRIPAPGAEHLGLSAALLARRITRPIREMSAFAGRLARGEYKHRVPEAGDGEIVSLGRALNSLADNLDRAETLRRHLVADVAHELRTPWPDCGERPRPCATASSPPPRRTWTPWSPRRGAWAAWSRTWRI